MEDKTIVTKKDIQTRLRRIEGQIKGIEKMVDNEACCKDILIQVAAARAAINKVGAIVLENYAKRCFGCDSENQEEIKKIEELVSTLTMFLK
ncbi:metal-sensitive transcriptional regulator [Clostridium aciditolerans]|uniref:Metal-sensitive transcriptional regulator n=1 Tax=Clostridium aciditolerans TaxID=339861 RepID=A0A934M3G5_9CLOT|nr:metal-sensitive transcriptional regulator [Clostridium aciditolerans]MBI6873000.1 metal-sensitive transcriptional regulator [Clostridium aciditolerans]